jgi:hypothetical protein
VGKHFSGGRMLDKLVLEAPLRRVPQHAMRAQRAAGKVCVQCLFC